MVKCMTLLEKCCPKSFGAPQESLGEKLGQPGAHATIL